MDEIVTAAHCVACDRTGYDPTPGTIPWCWIFKSSMLMLVHERRNRLLDLSWTDERTVESSRRSSARWSA